MERWTCGHVVVGRNHDVLFEIPFEAIDDVTLLVSLNINANLLLEKIKSFV